MTPTGKIPIYFDGGAADILELDQLSMPSQCVPAIWDREKIKLSPIAHRDGALGLTGLHGGFTRYTGQITLHWTIMTKVYNRTEPDPSDEHKELALLFEEGVLTRAEYTYTDSEGKPARPRVPSDIPRIVYPRQLNPVRRDG